MVRVVVTHGRERFRKPVFSFPVKVGLRGEHAMVVTRRSPYLTKGAFGHQAVVSDSVPEGTADSAGVGSSVEDCAHYFNLARSSITVFAKVAVETQRTIIASLSQALLLQKVNGKNRCMAAVAAAECERPAFQIRDGRNGAASDRNDLGHPAQVGIAHGDRTTGVAAPLIRLKVSEVCVPRNIDM